MNVPIVSPIPGPPPFDPTPGISSKSSRSTLSRQDDLLNIPAATEAFRQREFGPNIPDEERLTAFPFPLQTLSPQPSPRVNALLDDFIRYREGQGSPKPILGQRFPRPIPEHLRPRNRRAATVLSLIDELANARAGLVEEPDPSEDSPALPSLRPRPSNHQPEERYKAYHDDDQRAGVEAFHKFEECLASIDHRLLAFHNAVRHLGSSVGIFVSAVTLRDRFKDVLLTLRDESSIAFPALAQHFDDAQAKLHALGEVGAEREGSRPDPSGLSNVLELLALDLERFLSRINEISEFAEEGINTCVTAFVVDIRFWAESLDEFKDKMRTKELSKYVHDITEPFGTHVLIFSAALTNFIDNGVPTIRFAQQQAGRAYLNLSTVSTLLSGVTATTIQFTYADAATVLQQSVNLLWILSLVFSIASAINAQLAYYWSSTKFRSPRSQVPWWGFMVITQAPLYFLVSSVIAFSTGLVCFAFSAFPRTIIPIVTTIGTAVTLTSLVAVLFWLAGERWAFIHSKGTRWFITYAYPLSDLDEWSFRYSPRAIFRRVRRLRLWFRTRSWRRTHRNMPSTIAATSVADLEAFPRSIRPSMRSDDEAIGLRPPVVSPQPTGHIQTIPIISIRSASQSASGMVIESPNAPPRRKLGITHARATLHQLTPSDPVYKHASPVLHVAFSPDGRSLASCGWDKHVLLWKAEGDSMSVYKTLVHPAGAVRYVCWSPDGRMILGRMRSTIVLWDVKSGDSEAQMIQRGTDVSSIGWMPSGRSIVLVEGSQISIVGLTGSMLSSHLLPRLKVHDFAITKDSARLVAVATLEFTTSGLTPSKLTPEKRLLVYNLTTRTIEDQLPMLHSARRVSLSSNDSIVLVTYDKKAPQLFRLTDPPDATTRHLAFLHSCHYPDEMEAVGPSSIGALCATTEDDQLIICAGKEEVRLWERETGRLFGTTEPTNEDDVELTCAAWNHGAVDQLCLAAGSNDGGLRFWKAPLP